jgi:AraC family transcriptional regulator
MVVSRSFLELAYLHKSSLEASAGQSIMANFWVSSYEPNSKMRPHSHEQSHFTVVLQGNYDEVIDGRTTQHRFGSMLFYPAEQMHSQRFGENGSRGLMFAPPASCFELLSAQGFALDRASHLKEGSVSRIARRFLAEARHEDPFTPLTLNSLLLEFVAAFGRFGHTERQRKAPLWLMQIRESLEEQPDTIRTNEQLARQAGKHPVHLAKAFRRHFGETVGEFQRRLRLRKAETMLTKKHISLVEIAFECGFSSQAHFSRSFRCAFGMTPSQFRSERR